MIAVAKKDVVVPLVPAALSALLVVGGMSVFSACHQRPDGTWMQCHRCQNTVVASAAGLVVVFGAAGFVRNRAVRVALQALAIVISVVVFFIPGIICPLCMMETMRCHTVFQPFVRIMSVLISGSGIVALVKSLRKGKAA